MGSAKRARQRRNRAMRIEAERRAARRRKWTRRVVLVVALVAVVVGAYFAANYFGIGVADDTPEDVPVDTVPDFEITDDSYAPDPTTTTAATTTMVATGEETGEPETPTTAGPAPVSTEAREPAADYAGFRAQPTACGAEAPDERTAMSFDTPSDQGLSGIVTVQVDTSCGPLVFELDADAAPQTVNSFVFLAREGFFDGTVCHRLIPGFVLQCGDPTATGAGGPGYTVPDEFPEPDFVYEEGVLAMANAGPGTTGSQFFIVIGDASFLGSVYSVFGSFTDTEGTLASLVEVPLGSLGGEQSRPLETIYLDRVTVKS